ncbi:acid protease [Ganoderma leucocontextum]|nr:acid protease [Ganoderma leucocontextum]
MVSLSCRILTLALLTSLPTLCLAARLDAHSSGPNGGLVFPLVRRKSSGGQVGLNDVSDSLYTVPVTVGKSTANLSLSTNVGDLYAFTTACNSPVCYAYNGALYDKSASFTPGNNSEVPLLLETSDLFDPSMGQIGRDILAIGGLTMQNQTIGAVDNATSNAIWNGTAGVLGLAFPSKGSYVQAFAMLDILNFGLDNLTTDNYLKQLANLGAFIPRLVLNGVIDQPMFSISLQGSRNGIAGTGQLTIGRLPDGVDNSSVTWVPVRLYDTENGGISSPSNWEVEIDGVFLDGEELPGSKQSAQGIAQPSLSAVVDTNAIALGGPQDVVKNILSNVSPAFASNSNSAPTLPCGAPHNLTFQIGGKAFSIDANDFVAQSDPSTCVANVVDIPAPSNQSLFSWSLGQPFLRSNLVVFYYGNFSHPSFDPPRMGFVPLVGPGAAKLNAAGESKYGATCGWLLILSAVSVLVLVL